jgi:hypothetical protein
MDSMLVSDACACAFGQSCAPQTQANVFAQNAARLCEHVTPMQGSTTSRRRTRPWLSPTHAMSGCDACTAADCIMFQFFSLLTPLTQPPGLRLASAW